MRRKNKYSASNLEKEEKINELFSFLYHHREIYAVYLFGSFVNKELFADIDLGILLQEMVEDILEYELELENKLENIARFRMDVRVLNNAPISFAQNVIRYGRLILDREPNMRSDFESYVLKKYFDFARFRQIYLAEVINAPL